MPADGFVQVWPDSTGKIIDASELTVNAKTVERQRIILADPTSATSFANVANNALNTGAFGTAMRGFSPEQASASPDLTKVTTQLQTDEDNSLMIRGQVLTDEGSFRDDFGEEGPWTKPLTGLVTVVNGSTAVLGNGTVFTTEIEERDYFKTSSDTETKWTQIESIIDDTHLFLDAGYTGVSQAGVAAVYSDWPSVGTIGSGISVVEANSLLIITTGTTSGDQKILYKLCDYLPVSMVMRCRISQQITNQEFGFGFADNPASPGHFVKVAFTGGDASKITFTTGCTSNAAYQQTGTYTIPNGLTTSTGFNTFKIDITTFAVILNINGVQVAQYTYHMPYRYEALSAFIYAKNTGTPTSSTDFILDYLNVSNYNAVSIQTHTPLDTNTTITTSQGNGISPWYATIAPNSRLRVSGETTAIFEDNFNSFDTTNRWNTPVTSGAGSASVATGALVLTTDTNTSTAVAVTSRITFDPPATNFIVSNLSIKIEAVSSANSAITNTHRFWGVGTPNASFTAATPLLNAIGFEINTDGLLYACIYSNNVRTFFQNIPLPTDGNYHRYRMNYRSEQVNWYIDTFDIPNVRANYQVVSNIMLPLRLHSINSASSAPGTAPTFNCLALGLADSGNNEIAISDGTYPWRKATVTPAGNLQVLDAASVAAGTTAPSVFGMVGGKTNDGTAQYQPVPLGAAGRSVIIEGVSGGQNVPVLLSAQAAIATTSAPTTLMLSGGKTNDGTPQYQPIPLTVGGTYVRVDSSASATSGTTAPTEYEFIGGKTNDGTPQYQPLPLSTGGRSVQIEYNSNATTAKGTQATVAVPTQDLKDSGRIPITFFVDNIAGVTTEALATMTIWRGGSSSSSTNYTVTSGKTFRMTSFAISVKNGNNGVQSTSARLRSAASGISTTSCVVAVLGTSSTAAITAVTGNASMIFADGYEIAPTTQVAISHLDSATVNNTVTYCVTGYEY